MNLQMMGLHLHQIFNELGQPHKFLYPFDSSIPCLQRLNTGNDVGLFTNTLVNL